MFRSGKSSFVNADSRLIRRNDFNQTNLCQTLLSDFASILRVFSPPKNTRRSQRSRNVAFGNDEVSKLTETAYRIILVISFATFPTERVYDRSQRLDQLRAEKANTIHFLYCDFFLCIRSRCQDFGTNAATGLLIRSCREPFISRNSLFRIDERGLNRRTGVAAALYPKTRRCAILVNDTE